VVTIYLPLSILKIFSRLSRPAPASTTISNFSPRNRRLSNLRPRANEAKFTKAGEHLVRSPTFLVYLYHHFIRLVCEIAMPLIPEHFTAEFPLLDCDESEPPSSAHCVLACLACLAAKAGRFDGTGSCMSFSNPSRDLNVSRPWKLSGTGGSSALFKVTTARTTGSYSNDQHPQAAQS